jgi:hypothetical protein
MLSSQGFRRGAVMARQGHEWTDTHVGAAYVNKRDQVRQVFFLQCGSASLLGFFFLGFLS